MPISRDGTVSHPLVSTSQGFSVALCTYNGSRHIYQQLESLANQQRRPDELVICDDGSSDATVAVAEAFAREVSFPVIVIRNQTNLGYQRNFLQAVSLCSKDLIAFCDQDDLWYPQKLARLEALFSSQPVMAGIFSNGDLIDSNSTRIPGDLWSSFSFTAHDQRRLRSGQALNVLLQRNVVTGMALAFRSSFKPLLLDIPTSWPHDAWLALMLANEAKLLACPEHLVAYRVHSTQTIGVPVTWKGKLQYVKSYGIGKYVELSRERNLNEYKLSQKQSKELLQVYSKCRVDGEDALFSMARNKLEHAQLAADLLAIPRRQRWPSVLANASEYKNYSPTGLKAMVRDLLL